MQKASVLAEALRWFCFRLLCCGLGFAGVRLGELAAEALDTTCGVDQLLLAGEERVAGGADFEDDVALVRRAGLKVSSAGALDGDVFVLRVNSFFWHLRSFCQKPLWLLDYLPCWLADRLQRCGHVTSKGLSRRLYGSSFSLAARYWIRTALSRFRGTPPPLLGYFASKSNA